MKISKIILSFSYLVFTLPSSRVFADIGAELEQAKALFEQGRYQESLQYFNKARDKGAESTALIYNLGSVHYRLGEYEQAEHYFQRLTTSDSTAALAYYNLGLVANKNGDRKLSVEYFDKCKATSNDTKLSKLAGKQINRLTAEQPSPWSGYLYGGYGHDSNITSAPSGVASNQSDNFWKASALANLQLTGSRDNGLIASASIFTKSYLDSSFNDNDAVTLSASLRNTVDSWKLSYTGGIRQSTYGDADYLRYYRFTIQAKRPVHGKNRILFRYRYEDINSLSPQFDYLDGSRQKLRAEYLFRWAADKLRLRFEHENNDRQNTATRNYSPTRNSITAKYDRKLNSENAISAEAKFRNSDYDPAPALDREDDRLSAAVQYDYRLDKNWKISGRLQHRNNDSNDAGLDYKKTIATVSLSRFF